MCKCSLNHMQWITLTPPRMMFGITWTRPGRLTGGCLCTTVSVCVSNVCACARRGCGLIPGGQFPLVRQSSLDLCYLLSGVSSEEPRRQQTHSVDMSHTVCLCMCEWKCKRWRACDRPSESRLRASVLVCTREFLCAHTHTHYVCMRVRL